MHTHSRPIPERALVGGFLVATLMAVAVVFGTSVGAQADGGTSDVVHACVKDSGGDITIVAPGEDCKKNWTPLHLAAFAEGDLAEAIEAAPSSTRVNIACGVYPIAATVEIAVPMHISGSSRDCVFIEAANNNLNVFEVSAQGVTIENVTLVGDGTTTAAGNGNLILVTGDGDFAVRNSRFFDHGQSAIRIIKSIGSGQDYWIESNEFLDGVDNAGFQHDIATFGAVSNVFVTNNTFAAHADTPVEFSFFAANAFENLVVSNNRFSGAYQRSCVTFTDETPDGSVRVHGVVVADNVISDCRAQAIMLKNTPRFAVTGNRITDVNAIGIGSGIDGDISVGGVQGTVAGNSISGGRVGIQVTRMASSDDTDLDDGFNVSGNLVKNAALDGIRLSTGARSVAVSGNTILDCDGTGVAIKSAELVANVAIDGNVIRGCTLGIATVLPSGVTKDRIVVSNNVIADSGNHGMQITNTANSMIVYNQVFNSGTEAANQSGINVAGVTSLRIAGNIIGGQPNGITLGGGSVDVQILDNDLRNNTTDAIVNPQLAALMRGNLGFATESRGEAIIGAGFTVVVVDHLLAVTPNPGDLQATPLTDLGGAVQFWISAVTSSTFELHIDGPPASDVSFSWSADSG